MGSMDFEEIILFVFVFLVGLCVGCICMYGKPMEKRMDVNGDGKISASDYVIIKNYIMDDESKED